MIIIIKIYIVQYYSQLHVSASSFRTIFSLKMTSKPSYQKENITSVVSVRLSWWDKVSHTGNILVKFHIWYFEEYMLTPHTKICPHLTQYLAVIGLYMYLKDFLFYMSWKLTLKTHLTTLKPSNPARFFVFSPLTISRLLRDIDYNRQ